MMTADLVLARLRDAASTGTYTRLHVSMGALDTVRGLPGFEKVTPTSTRWYPANTVGHVVIDEVLLTVLRDPTLSDGFVSLSDNYGAHAVGVWLEDEPMPMPFYYGAPHHDAVVDALKRYDLITVRADLERRYPGCVFTDAFVQAYAEGRA